MCRNNLKLTPISPVSCLCSQEAWVLRVLPTRTVGRNQKKEINTTYFFTKRDCSYLISLLVGSHSFFFESISSLSDCLLSLSFYLSFTIYIPSLFVSLSLSTCLQKSYFRIYIPIYLILIHIIHLML